MSASPNVGSPCLGYSINNASALTFHASMPHLRLPHCRWCLPEIPPPFHLYPIEFFHDWRPTATQTIFSIAPHPTTRLRNAASGSQPRKSNTSSSKSHARALQLPSSSTSFNANAAIDSSPRGEAQRFSTSSSLLPSSHSTRPSHSQDDNVPPTPNQQGKMKQSPAQSTPHPQPRKVRRNPGLINAVSRELQVKQSTALEAERLAILETEEGAMRI
jgi:hypothetical protein